MHRFLFAVLASTAGVAVVGPVAGQSLTLLIESGDEVPGTGGATVFNFSRLQVNDQNEFAVLVDMEPGTGSPPVTSGDRLALMRSTATGAELIMRAGDHAYDDFYSFLFDPSLFPGGIGLAGFDLQDDRIVFYSRVTGTEPMFGGTRTRTSVFEWTPAGTTFLTDNEMPWDLIPGHHQDEAFTSLYLFPDEPSTVGFEMRSNVFTGPQETREFYITAPGVPAAELQPIQWVTDTGETFEPRRFERTTPTPLVPWPDIAMGSYLHTNPGVDWDNDDAILVFDGSGMTEIMREGQPAVGVPGTTYGSMYRLVTGTGGSLVAGEVRDTSGDRHDAVWRIDDSGTIAPLIVMGEPAPYLGGVTPRDVRRWLPIKDGLFISITENDSTSNDCDAAGAALIINTDGSVQEVALYGQPLPGLDNVVPSVSCNDIFVNPVSTDPNEREFYFEKNDSIFRYDPATNSIVPFAIVGEPFDFSPKQDGSDMRTLDGITSPLIHKDKLYFYVYWDGYTKVSAFVYDPDAATCIADVNGDGQLVPNDFTAWILAFNTGGPACDQNGDGDCRANDFTAWILNYNTGC